MNANDYDGIGRSAKIYHGKYPQQLEDGSLIFMDANALVRKIVKGEVFTTMGEISITTLLKIYICT